MPAGKPAGRARVEAWLDNTRLLRGLTQAHAKLRQFASQVQRVGTSMFRAGAVGTAPFAGAVTVFTRFSDRMLQVQAISGATGDEFKKLEERAKVLGRTTSFSASQVAEGMKFLGMAGFDTMQIIAGIEPVLRLAAAGAVELGMAADIASDVGTAYGLTADEIGRVSDVIAKTATSANTNVEMMGETFRYVGSVADTAGQSLEETAAAIGILGNSSMKASMAGTSLAEAMIRMGGEAAPVLRRFNVAATDMNDNFRPIMDVMRDLGEATEQLSERERLSVFIEAFGKRAGRAAIILAKTGEQIDVMRGKMANAEGSARRMAAIMQSGLGGAFRSLLSAIEGIAIAVGETLEPQLSAITRAFTGVGRLVVGFIESNKGLVLVLANVAAGVAAMGIGLIGLSFGLKAAGFALISVKAALGLLVSTLTFMFSPLVLIGGLILGIGTMLYNTTEIGRKAFDSIAEGAVDLATGFFDWFGPVIDWFAEMWGDIKTVALTAFEGISAALKSGDLELAAQIAMLGLKSVVFTVLDSIASEWFEWRDAILDVVDMLHSNLATSMVNMWADIQSVWINAATFFEDVFLDAFEAVRSATESLQGWIAKALVGIMAKLDPTIDADDARAIIDEQTRTGQQQRAEQRREQSAEMERDRRARLEAIEKSRAGTIDEIASQNARAKEARRERSRQQQAQIDRELAATQQQLAAATAKATEQQAESEGSEEREREREKVNQRIRQRLGISGLSSANATASGSFNPFAARGLGGYNYPKLTADRLADAVSELKKLNKKQAVFTS